MASYVKFMRGTPEAFAALTHKDEDTLYFIAAKDSTEGSMYLGAKQILSGDELATSSIDQLQDVVINKANLIDKQVLMYDETENKWINSTLEDVIGLYVGATATSAGVPGLVPSAPLGQTNLFLRSDGSWVTISGEGSIGERNVISVNNEAGADHETVISQATNTLNLTKGDLIIIKDIVYGEVNESTAYTYDGNDWVALNDNISANKVYFKENIGELAAAGKMLPEVLEEILSIPGVSADGKSIKLDNNELSLVNYGVQYYKYIPATGAEGEEGYVAGHYELQIVDENNPWIAGLEPRVALEDEELVLAWYEPNPSTIEGINTQISTLQTTVVELQETIINKANAADVYTKTQTDTKIAEAVATADHLKRVKVDKLDDIDVNAVDAGQYIYMVPTGLQDDDNKYYEYVVIDGVLEPVGTWEVDLSQYATKTELADTNSQITLVKADVSNITTFLNNLTTKVEENTANITINANNIATNASAITLVQTSLEQYKTTTNETISLVQNSISSIESQLNALSSTVSTHTTEISSLNDKMLALQNNVSSLATSLDNYVLKTVYETDISEIKDALTWKEIGTTN